MFATHLQHKRTRPHTGPSEYRWFAMLKYTRLTWPASEWLAKTLLSSISWYQKTSIVLRPYISSTHAPSGELCIDWTAGSYTVKPTSELQSPDAVIFTAHQFVIITSENLSLKSSNFKHVQK